MPHDPNSSANPAFGMRVPRAYRRQDHPDRLVAELAARQFGVVTTAQVRACGLSRDAIAHRLRTGRFVSQYRGVYAVGHEVLRPVGTRLAAVLACGSEAALSHRAGGRHWSVWWGSSTLIDVTRPRGHGNGPAGVRLHLGPLEPGDVVVLDGVPVTSLARTTIDIAYGLGDKALRRLIDDVVRHPAYDHRALEAELERGRPGTRAVRKQLRSRHPDSHRTRSEFEAIALPLLAHHGLPQPEVNVWLPALSNEVDLLWRRERVVVEWDSRAHHDDDPAFEHDREQSVELITAGYVPLRFTWRQLTQRPDWVAFHIRKALHHRGAA